MTDDQHQDKLKELIRRIGRLVAGLLSSNWLVLLTRLWQLIGFPTLRRASEGLYEILDYELTLDLRDRKGKQAVFRRRQRVRFLQDHIIAYQDEAWGDGKVVAGYHCSPGVPVDVFRVGSRHLILISLRQAKNRGDVVEFNIERKVEGGFTKKEEWLEVETRYPTRRLRIDVLFPARRPCRTAWLVARSADRTINLDANHFSRTRDGRQRLSWEAPKPMPHETYAICWVW
jgi:hypothetical protein